MRGDLIFWHERDIWARLVQWRTNKGPFNHVEVDFGDGNSFGAKWHGVDFHPMPTPSMLYEYPQKPPENSVDYAQRYNLTLTSKQLQEGIAWLEKQRGKSYDVTDILLNIYAIFNPHGPFKHTPQAFTCSELVLQYLLEMGYEIPKPYMLDVGGMQAVSPNGLARMLGIL